MSTQHINGFDMSYEIRGEGEPLFLLHGMNGAGANWDLVFPGAIEGFQTIIPDLRGHGHSNNPPAQFSIRQCADDILALADALDVDTFKAIGLSLGGNAMLHVAYETSPRVVAMAIVSATPYFPNQARTVMAQILSQQPSPAERDQMLSMHTGGDEQIAELRRYAKQMSERHDDMDFSPPKLAAITAQTLIVHGDRDPLYPIDMPIMLHKAIPNNRLWVIPGAGHGPVFLEYAPTFRETAIKFLQASKPASPTAL